MKALAIDTSNQTLGVALVEEGQVIGEYMTNLKKNHSIRLMPAVQRLLEDCETEPSELSKIIVAKGPGSYTGVRIGVTVAKTLAWSLSIPLIGVSSLAVLAGAGRYFDGYVCPLFDARRGLVYTGLYRWERGELRTVEEDTNIPAAEWAQVLKTKDDKVLFVGNDIPIHEAVFVEVLKEKAYFAALSERNPRPGELGIMGLSLPEEDIHSFTPNYIRLVEAEAKWLEQQKQNQDGK